MSVMDWVKGMSRSGVVCVPYMRRISAVESKADLFRVLCDANGGAWLFNIHAKEPFRVPVDDFMEEFKTYINGGRVMEYPKGYTSKLYCRYEGDIEILADTTLLYLLECRASVIVPPNAYPTVVLSDRSRISSVAMLPGSRLNIELYGDAEVIGISGDLGRVKTIRRQ